MKMFFDRLNLSALNPRERGLVTMAGGVLLVFVFTMAAWAINSRLRETERRIEQKRRGLERVHALSSKYFQAKEQLRRFESRIARNKINLFTYLDKVAKSTGVQLSQIEEKQPPPRAGGKASRAKNENIKEELVQVKITKTDFDKLLLFLEKIESRDKLVIVRSMTLKRRYDKDKLIDARIQISTYKKRG
ncbi:MAG: type II secretion system protein M [Deltaproteobacteria bacterium]|nr:type II secretion system protein M [Deltaproteobacteria bacterium]